VGVADEAMIARRSTSGGADRSGDIASRGAGREKRPDEKVEADRRVSGFDLRYPRLARAEARRQAALRELPGDAAAVKTAGQGGLDVEDLGFVPARELRRSRSRARTELSSSLHGEASSGAIMSEMTYGRLLLSCRQSVRENV
jgi:hypothetical protein